MQPQILSIPDRLSKSRGSSCHSINAAVPRRGDRSKSHSALTLNLFTSLPGREGLIWACCPGEVTERWCNWSHTCQETFLAIFPPPNHWTLYCSRHLQNNSFHKWFICREVENKLTFLTHQIAELILVSNCLLKQSEIALCYTWKCFFVRPFAEVLGGKAARGFCNMLVHLADGTAEKNHHLFFLEKTMLHKHFCNFSCFISNLANGVVHILGIILKKYFQ